MKIILMAVGALLIAGCATTGTLDNAAERLDRSAAALHAEVQDEGLDERLGVGLEDDAEGFADAASDFRREVEDGARREDLREEFEEVSERYHALREEFEDEDTSSEEREAFDSVTNAYLDLEREMEYRVSGRY